MFKPGDFVTCIDPAGVGDRLIKDKVYRIQFVYEWRPSGEETYVRLYTEGVLRPYNYFKAKRFALNLPKVTKVRYK